MRIFNVVEKQKMQVAIWPGWASDDVVRFLGDNLSSEERAGCGAVGYFLFDLDGRHKLLAKNDHILKIREGVFKVYTEFEFRHSQYEIKFP